MYCIKTITEHTLKAYSLLLLKDKRVASCSADRTIRIYDPSNNYHCYQVLERHNSHIFSICELEDGTIVSSSFDNTIMIDEYKIKDAYDGILNKLITLPNNRIASCSEDKKIKLWKSNPPFKVLEGHNASVTSLLYIKDRDIMISGAIDCTLRLWNMSTYQ